MMTRNVVTWRIKGNTNLSQATSKTKTIVSRLNLYHHLKQWNLLTFTRTIITWWHLSVAPEPRAVVSTVSRRGIGAGSCPVPSALPTGFVALWPAGPISVAAIIWLKDDTNIQSRNSFLIDKLKNGFISSHLRGHEMRLQALDSIAGPKPTAAQSRPPLVGEGLLQVLYLCVRPPPHVTSQSDQSLHTE